MAKREVDLGWARLARGGLDAEGGQQRRDDVAEDLHQVGVELVDVQEQRAHEERVHLGRGEGVDEGEICVCGGEGEGEGEGPP